MKKILKSLKKITALSLGLMILSGLVFSPLEAEAAKKKSGNATYAEGDDIAFGNLDGNILNWTILKYDDTTKIAFVVSRKTLSTTSVTAYRTAVNMSYVDNKKSPGYVRWSENYWRGWCNEIFYVNSFNDEERAKIQKTTLSEADAQKSLMNFYHDTSLDGDYIKNNKTKQSLNMNVYNTQTTTSDYIFFLSSDEYTEYKDKIKFETKGIWPLRTNSFDDPAFGLFCNDNDKLLYKNYYYMGDGIRPAMYVQLGEPEVVDDSADAKTTDGKTADATKNDATNAGANNTNSTKNTNASINADKATTAASTKTSAKETKTEKAPASSEKKYANNGTNTGNITLPDDSQYSMSAGTTAQVAIDLDYLNSTEKDYTITYKSSDASVLNVDSSGKITATGTGTGVVTAKMKKSNGKVYTMSCRVDVK